MQTVDMIQGINIWQPSCVLTTEWSAKQLCDGVCIHGSRRMKNSDKALCQYTAGIDINATIYRSLSDI